MDDFNEEAYRHIALAAVTQCATLVNELATTGTADPKQMHACLEPVFIINPDSTHDIYPEVSALNGGLMVLQQSFDSEGLKRHAEPVRYLLGMLLLRQKLDRQPAMQGEIRRRLEQIDAERTEGEFPYQELARLYQETISKLSFRIHVSGNPEHLREQINAEKIRALLLAGIRSAVLWHQLGGRRWQLFFSKKKIKTSISEIRRHLIN